MPQVRHAFASAKDDGSDSSLVRPSNWNADHVGLVLVRKTANEAVAVSATLQDDDHLFFALAANETWIFELLLWVAGPTAADIKLAFTVPTGATLIWSGHGHNLNVVLTDEGTIVNPPAEASGTSLAFGTQGTKVPLRLFGMVVNGANAGNLQLQWAQNGATGTTTVYANSWLKATRVA